MIDEEKVQLVLNKLETAAEELLFPSESDEPFVSFFWEIESEKPLTAEQVLSQLGLPKDTHIKQKGVDEFFRVATTPQEWHSDEDLNIVEKFQELSFAIRKNLVKPQVFLVGKVEIDAYIVGKTPEGVWAGLQTKVINT